MFLAKLIGLYMLIQGITLFLRASDLKGIAKEFMHSPLMQIFGGSMAVIAGLLIVMNHNVWDTYWQSFISLFGWLALLKGVMLLWAPELMRDVMEMFERPAAMRVASLTVYTIAILMLAFGFQLVI